MNRLQDIREHPALAPQWLLGLTLLLPTIVGLLVGFAPIIFLGATDQGLPPTVVGVGYKHLFAMAFCGTCLVVSIVVLAIALPIYLFSSNKDRIKRAGGIVKSTLGFVVGSGGALAATLSFENG